MLKSEDLNQFLLLLKIFFFGDSICQCFNRYLDIGGLDLFYFHLFLCGMQIFHSRPYLVF